MIKLPVLYTPRLILREICLGDAEDMFYYAQHPRVRMPDGPRTPVFRKPVG